MLKDIVLIKESDYSDLINDGEIIKGGITHSYDSNNLYIIDNPTVSQANHADTADYATHAGVTSNLEQPPAIFQSSGSSSQIQITAGNQTSNPFTVPYADNAGYAEEADHATEADNAGYADGAYNLNGGAAGYIPYQAAPGLTTFLSGSATNGYVLKYNTQSKAPYWAADNDTKVTQTVTGTSHTSSRPLILGYSYNDDAAFNPTTTTNTVYATKLAKFKPATGKLYVVGMGKLGTDGKEVAGSTTTFFNTSGSVTDLSTSSVQYASSASNADTVDGYHGSSFVRYGEYLMPTNPFASNRDLKINTINDGFYAANERATVTITRGNGSTVDSIKSRLFDGNYETYINVPAGDTLTILIDSGTTPLFGTYSYGTTYVSFYYTNIPESVSMRVYGTSGSPAATGWVNLSGGIDPKSGTSKNVIWYFNNTGVYNATKWEITITAKTDAITYVTQVDHHFSRGATAYMPVVTKFPIKQDLYGDIEAPKFIKRGGTSAQFLKADGTVDSTSYAALASPAFTGAPTAPTANAGTNTTQIATTAFVKTEINNVLAASDAMVYKGTLGTGGTITSLPATHSVGDTYKVITAGTYAGAKCEVGDMIICITNGTASVDAHWTAVQTNIDGAVTGPTASVTNRVAIFDGTTGKVIKDSGFTISASVPSGAVFTDTTYESKTAASGGTEVSLVTTGEKYTWNNKVDKSAGVTAVSYDTTNKKITRTINGTAADVVTAATIVSDGGGANKKATYGIYGELVNGIYNSNYIARGDLGCVGFDNTYTTISIYEAASGSSYPSSPTKTYTESSANVGTYIKKGLTTTLHTAASGSKVKVVVSVSSNYLKAVGLYFGQGGTTINYSTIIGTGTTPSYSSTVNTYGSWHIVSCMDATPQQVTIELNTGNANCAVVVSGVRCYVTNPNNLRFVGVANKADELTSNPSLQTSGTTQVTVTAGGRTSSAYTVPYATSTSTAGYAGSASTATTLSAAPTVSVSGSQIAVVAGTKTSSYATVPYATSASDSTKLNGQSASYYASASHAHSYVPLAGGTMSGILKFNRGAAGYADALTSGGLDMNNSNIIGVNSIYTADASDNSSEGIHFYRDTTHVDTLWASSGNLYFSPNRTIGSGTSAANSNKVWHAGNDGSGSGLDADTVDGKHVDDLVKLYTYTIPARKGVRITYQSQASCLITCSRTNGTARLVLIGSGYGAGGTTRNDFTELVSPSSGMFQWSLPASDSVACSVDIMQTYNGDGTATVRVHSSGTITFTEITELATPAQNNPLLSSTNYTDYTVKKDGTGATGSWGINITGTASNATNLAGGAANKIPYQTAAGTTAFLNTGSSGQVLKAGTNGALSWGTDNDTKNTAGTTNSASVKLFVVGAKEQSANPQTFTNVNTYINTDNNLYSNGFVAATSVRAKGGDVYVGSASTAQCHQQYDAVNKCLKFIFD